MLNYANVPIGIVGRVFSNGLGAQGSIPGRVIPKIQKMVFDDFLLNTQHYSIIKHGSRISGTNQGKE